MSNNHYTIWLENEEENLKGMWESMGLVERFEEGPDLETFCRNQYALQS